MLWSLVCVRLRLSGCSKRNNQELKLLWQRCESLLSVSNRITAFWSETNICIIVPHRLLAVTVMQKKSISLQCESFSPYFLWAFSRSSLFLTPNWAQLSSVTHRHSFVSSLHHFFAPSVDLGIHLSIHLSLPFSLTSGNDEKRQRGREKKIESRS